MFGFLLALLILDGLFLTVIVLLQSGKGGGLAAMGGGAGTDNLIGGRQAATLLTKATWVSGGVFLGLSLVLAVMSSQQRTAASDSVLRNLQRNEPAASPAPVQLPGTEPAADGAQPAPETTPPATTTTGQ